MTAIVFNCHYNGLSIIRELGRNNVEVFALDSIRSVGTYSRYAKYLTCPDPLVAEKAFIDFLLKLGPTFESKPILFPTNDHWATAVSHCKPALSQYYLPCVADWATMELLIRKQRFYEWAEHRGYPVPRSWKHSQLDCLAKDNFPVAAKPEYRRISGNDSAAKELSRQLDQLRLTVLRNRTELDQFVALHTDLLEYFIFQEYVEGLSDCMFTVGIYANRQHEVLGLFSGRKVRGFPPDVGDCILGQAEEVPASLKQIVKQICRELRYHGIAEFEFKRDAVTGEFKLIEINPRSWSWVGITPACGVSLPKVAYLDLTGGETVQYTESNVTTGTIKWVRILDDFLNCFYFNRRIGFPEWDMAPLQWWKTIRANRLVVAEFAWDDLLPGLYSLYLTFKSLIGKLTHKLGLWK